MDQRIDKVDKSEFQEIVNIWEASVRATHDFLTEEDIEYFKPLILNQYLDAVSLSCIRDDEKKILGFMGVTGQSLEMLFVHPKAIGTGIGKSLISHAIDDLNIIKVDVNEDNEHAVRFYERFGFQVIKRSPVDDLGKPYPILHMTLVK